MKGLELASVTEIAVRTSEPPRLHVRQRLRELWASRQILANLVRKEIKVKYKSSVLGAAWSMLNPVLYLAVFSLVFSIFLQAKTPHFPVYLLSGLLAWNLFATSLGLATRSVVDNANLVTKVYFPREILPLASVGAAGVDFLLQALVLLGFMAGTRFFHFGANLLLLPLAMLALVVFTSAMGLWVAALNVRYRDTQHLLGLALLTWFWLTPVIYPSGFVFQRFADNHLLGIPMFDLYLANPMAGVIAGFHRALYAVVRPDAGADPVLLPVSVPWLAVLLAAVTVGSIVLLFLAWRTFFRLSGDFAEEL